MDSPLPPPVKYLLMAWWWSCCLIRQSKMVPGLYLESCHKFGSTTLKCPACVRLVVRVDLQNACFIACLLARSFLPTMLSWSTIGPWRDEIGLSLYEEGLPPLIAHSWTWSPAFPLSIYPGFTTNKVNCAAMAVPPNVRPIKRERERERAQSIVYKSVPLNHPT